AANTIGLAGLAAAYPCAAGPGVLIAEATGPIRSGSPILPIASQCAPCCHGGPSPAAGPGGAVRLREALASLRPSGRRLRRGLGGPEGVCWSRRAYKGAAGQGHGVGALRRLRGSKAPADAFRCCTVR